MKQYQYAGDLVSYVREEDMLWAERAQRRVAQLRRIELDGLSALPWQAKLVRRVRGFFLKFLATPEVVHYEQVSEGPYSVPELKRHFCYDTLQLLKACERDGLHDVKRQDTLQGLVAEFVDSCARWRRDQEGSEHSSISLVCKGVRHAV